MVEHGKSFKTFTQIMADFSFDLAYKSIPEAMITTARRHLADSIACALGAYNTEAVRIVRTYALRKGGGDCATILGMDRKVSAALAALVNGTMVRYLDANDIFVPTRGGPSGHCSDGTPGLLALAEQYRCSGEELLTCLVASYELQGTVGEMFRFRDHGLHALTHAAWVIPIVAARLMGATRGQATHAAGLTVATSTVLNTWLKPTHSIPMIKSVAVGLVLERALEAAELATLGVTATEDAFETAFAGFGSDATAGVDPTQIEHLGKRWATSRNMIKLHPAQIYTQAAIEAALGLYQRGLRADKIDSLVLYGNRNICAGVQGSAQAFAPATREAADHSTPYVIAMALLRGQLTSREYDHSPWESAEVKALMSKITLVNDPERNQALDDAGLLGVRLVARLDGGGSQELMIHQPKGHPDTLLSDDELLNKMTWLLEGIAPAGTAARLIELCSRLSTVGDVKRLVELCDVTSV